MRAFLLSSICLLPAFAQAQNASSEPDSLKQNINEVIVTANKFSEQSKYVAQKVEVISSAAIDNSFTNNTAGLLEQTGKVFMQRSQLGGGSPVLRGFEASRILLVIDGVRMNNAIYRTGHLQNVITVDDDIIEKAEILYGPASTIYGSDALGGVIHLRTRKPILSASSKVLCKANGSMRYSSAYDEYSAHADVSIGGQKFGSLTSVSFSSFGDLRQGNSRSPLLSDFGKREQYIDRLGGTDTILANEDYNSQKFSGYRQYDILQKLIYQPKSNLTHELNLQYSTTTDVPRYDRLTDIRNGQLRWAEWYYGPQERLMAAYQYTQSDMNGFFDQMMIGASYQKIQESRMQRAYKNPLRQNRVEDIQVMAFNADLRKSKGRNELNIGVDGQFNLLESTAYYLNLENGERDNALDTRYPDGNNRMTYTGAYAQHLYKIIPGKLILNDGFRLNYVSLNSKFVDTSILHLPFTDVSQSNLTYSLNAGLIYLPDTKSKVSLSFSSGFRAPNIDDLAKVFESAGGSQLVVPNPGLKPEQTFNFDLTLNREFENGLTVEVSGFYTQFRNAIVLDRFSLNGADTVMYDDKWTPVVASQNKAEAYLMGFQGYVQFKPVRDFALYSTLTYTYGRYKDGINGHVPLDHIPPVYGKTGIIFAYKILSVDCYALYNGWKKLAEYNPYGEDNLQYATNMGMPSWMTFNINTNWSITKSFKAQVALENVFDKNYRAFASGISGAGRNLVLRLRYQM
jgi:hemoglobin/transferrin/lactoferrin receptor protein